MRAIPLGAVAVMGGAVLACAGMGGAEAWDCTKGGKKLSVVEFAFTYMHILAAALSCAVKPWIARVSSSRDLRSGEFSGTTAQAHGVKSQFNPEYFRVSIHVLVCARARMARAAEHDCRARWGSVCWRAKACSRYCATTRRASLWSIKRNGDSALLIASHWLNDWTNQRKRCYPILGRQTKKASGWRRLIHSTQAHA